MQNQILNSLDKNQLNVFVYFEYWVHYFKKPDFVGCVGYVTEKNKLIASYKSNNGEYFEWDGLCANSRYDIKTVETVYDKSEFRAFLFKDKKIFNITNKVLEDLRSKKL